jgi:DNA polymerase I
MKTLTSDWETTTSNKGNPFDQTNKAILLAMQVDENEPTSIYHPFTEDVLQSIQLALNAKPLLVFFNAKFDLHWYTRMGIDYESCKVWCCQLAEFLLSRQTLSYPSLEEVADRYGLGKKLDVVKLDYWDKGINTDQIPVAILSDYAKQDVSLTYQIYLCQLEEFKKKPALYKLFRLACEDLVFLAEMERTGIPYDIELCKIKSQETEKKIEKIYLELNAVYPDININFNSGDQLSAFLYGGTIYEEYKEHVGFYKTGEKAGQPKFTTKIKEHVLPRLVNPLPKSEVKKEGYYKTDVQTLLKLKGKAAKKFVGPLLELSKLEKLNSTYYRGLLEKTKEYGWEEGIIHGQFNQTVAATGRLSSSRPNQQNFAEECLDLFYSRFVD